MEQKQRVRWQTLRAKGKARYVLLHGVAPSLLLSVMIILMAYVLWPWEKFRDDPSKGALPLLTLGISVVAASVVGGYIGGVRTWDATEKKYLEADKSDR